MKCDALVLKQKKDKNALQGISTNTIHIIRTTKEQAKAELKTPYFF